MKKITLITLSGIIACCLVPIATAQAMQRQLQACKNAISVSTMCNPENLHDTLVYCGPQESHAIVIAKGDASSDSHTQDKVNPYVKRQGDDSPYVKRQGHGRAKKKNNDTAEDNSDADDLETDDFGDDSAVKFNRGLKNSSGYNEDL